MAAIYSGVVGAPVTPFKSNGEIDYETFAKQINFLIENGVRLIAHPMHIGESVNLTEAERKELAKVLASAAGRRVPLPRRASPRHPSASARGARRA